MWSILWARRTMECELEVKGDLLICERCGKCKMDRLVNAELSSEISDLGAWVFTQGGPPLIEW